MFPASQCLSCKKLFSSLSSSMPSSWRAGCTRASVAPGSTTAQEKAGADLSALSGSPYPQSQPLPTRIGQAHAYLGHWTSIRAVGQSWTQVGSNCQVWEGAETQACGRHLPAPTTISMPQPGSPSSIRPLPEPFLHIPFSGIFKRTPSTLLLPAEGGLSSPPHALFPPSFQEAVKDQSLVLKQEQASSPGQSLPWNTETSQLQGQCTPGLHSPAHQGAQS